MIHDLLIYYHDYHGWRDTKEDASEAFNAFTAEGAGRKNEGLKSVSFYTAADAVDYTVKVYSKFENGELQNELSSLTGTIANTGFHTVDLTKTVPLKSGDKFYVYVKLSKGGHPFDKTSDVPVLLGAKYRTIVESAANPGESFFKSARALA